MTQPGANHEAVAAPERCRIAVVASRFNDFIVERLLEGCTGKLAQCGVAADRITLVRVPGAFELPLAAAALARSGGVDAVIALGAVIRGETAHFDYIAAECARGLASVARESLVPVIFGVLTVDNEQQALARSADDEDNKGRAAAVAALQMVRVMGEIRP